MRLTKLRKTIALSETYTIKLPEFEGPFDLLLFFIERDELDIHDIPIAKVTKDFLTYIQQLELLNIDVASEFILVASSLMRIKAKMLLPRKEIDEQGEEIDPRQELIDRLIEYKRYKAVIIELKELEAHRAQLHDRGNTLHELENLSQKALADAELENLSLFRLLKAYEQVLDRYKYEQSKVIHTVVQYNYTIEERQKSVLNLLKIHQKMDFKSIFGRCENRLHAIFTFLAILELLQQEKIQLNSEHSDRVNSFELIPTGSMHSDAIETTEEV